MDEVENSCEIAERIEGKDKILINTVLEIIKEILEVTQLNSLEFFSGSED